MVQPTFENTKITQLPLDISEKCKKLMVCLNIEFACFDFIVNKDDDFLFLEINESGQFLFMDHCQEELHLADAFTYFLVNENCNKWSPRSGFSLGSIINSDEFKNL